MSALAIGLIYLGSFLVVGLVAKLAITKWMTRKGVDLPEVQAQAGPNRGRRRLFLLGAWRTED